MPINMNFSVDELRDIQVETAKPDMHPDTVILNAIKRKDTGILARMQQSLAITLENQGRKMQGK